MPRNKSEVEIVIDSRIEGRGFKQASDGLDDLDRKARRAGDGFSILDIAAGNLVANGLSFVTDAVRAGAVALFEWGKEAAQLGSDLAETESLLTNALGPAYADFNEIVLEVAESTGLSANSFKQSVSPIIAMTKAQGFAADEAGRVSAAFGQAALDLNSYFNSTTGFEDLQSALAGSSETLQKYGINANVAALQQEALRIGIIDTIEPLEQAERTTALLSLVQQQAADAMGDAERTSGGFANQQRSTNDLIKDFNTEIGVGITDFLQPWQRELNKAAKTSLPAFGAELSKTFTNAGLASEAIIAQQKETPGVLANSLYAFADFVRAGPFDEYVQGLVNAGQEIQNLNESIAFSEQRGGGRGGIRAAIDQSSFESAVEVAGSYDAALTTISSSNARLLGSLEDLQEYDYGDLSADEFFDSISTGSDEAVERVRNVSTAFVELIEQIEKSNPDILGVDSDKDFGKSAIDFAIENSQLGQASVETQTTLLERSGNFSPEDIAAQTVTAYEKQLANEFGAAISAIGDRAQTAEIATTLFTQVSDQVEAAGDDVEAVKAIVNTFEEDLARLSQNEYPVSIPVEVENIEQVRELRDLLSEVGGIDLPEFAGPSNPIDSPAAAANRRR